ncbi:MAG: nucleic acid-binding protein, partial [Candidatus Lambdaproteobacteria bacterium]|nr:nucleic acid-binding protein [Candidatus Lambdaproteobacteria bacterium]
TCTGCRVALPPQAYNILIANPSQHGTCAHCSRIVFYQAPENVEAKARGDSPAA